MVICIIHFLQLKGLHVKLKFTWTAFVIFLAIILLAGFIIGQLLDRNRLEYCGTLTLPTPTIVNGMLVPSTNVLHCFDDVYDWAYNMSQGTLVISTDVSEEVVQTMAWQNLRDRNATLEQTITPRPRPWWTPGYNATHTAMAEQGLEIPPTEDYSWLLPPVGTNAP